MSSSWRCDSESEEDGDGSDSENGPKQYVWCHMGIRYVFLRVFYTLITNNFY